MGISVRYYLFPEGGGEPRRVSHRLVDGLSQGTDSIPDYAGTGQKVVAAIIESEEGEPVRLLRTDASVWYFDGTGNIKSSAKEALRDAMEMAHTAPSQNGSVVSITSRLKRKRFDEQHRWDPGPAEINVIIKDIWPQGGVSLKLKSEKGTQARRPPLTYEARQAIAKARRAFEEINREISELKEPGLKGFAFEAKDRADRYREHADLYRAAAKMAERQLEILRRRRSGKGIWIAQVEVIRWKDNVGEGLATFEERVNGKAAAIKAAQCLLQLHADKFSDETTVEPRIITDLEAELSSPQGGEDDQ